MWSAARVGLGLVFAACASRAPEPPPHRWDVAARPALAEMAEAVRNGRQTCGIRRDGAMICVLDGLSFAHILRLDRPGAAGRVVAFSVTEDRGCVIDAAGAVWCWHGDALEPFLGAMRLFAIAGLRADRAAPVQVDRGRGHGCVTLANGRVACWGDRGCARHGQQGEAARARVVPGVRDAVEVGAGQKFACARRRDGEVRCWGDIPKLGPGGAVTPRCTRPTTVPGLGKTVKLAVEGGVGCALGDSGVLRCWGDYFNGTAWQACRLDPGRPVRDVSVDDEYVWMTLDDGRIVLHDPAGFCEVPHFMELGPR